MILQVENRFLEKISKYAKYRNFDEYFSFLSKNPVSTCKTKNFTKMLSSGQKVKKKVQKMAI